MKKTIRLTESDLHKLIKRAIYEATKGERGMSNKQKQRRRNANYIKDVNGSGDKYFHPNTYSDYEPSNVDRYERNAPFHGNDWFDDKVHMDRMKKHRSSQNHKDPDDFMESVIRESIKRVMNEELSDKVKRSMQMASDWIDVNNNNRMLTDFTPDMYSPNYRGNNNVYDLSNDVSPLGHKRHEEMNDAWDEHERNESKIRNIVRESIKRVVNESYLYTKDINTDDLRINGHWTEDGYAEWEATVDNGWYTLRGTYDGHDCELEEIIEGHSGHAHQHDIDDDAIDWFNQNICDRVKSWLDKYAEDYSEWHSKMYGDE